MGKRGESHLRSIYKTISWRVIATLITALVTYRATDEVNMALGVAFADTIIKLFVYYGHERLWTKVRLGKGPTPEYEI